MNIGKKTAILLAALAVSIINPLSIAQAADVSSGGTGKAPSAEKTATAPVAGTAGPMLEGSAKTFHSPRTWKIPLGHPDFYPSDERPIGWRGDRTGAWPGATGVAMWDAETGENIVWKVNTPREGFSQPIVVGEKVFVTCEPNLLLCYSIHTGEELWRTAIDHTTKMDTETAKAARAEMAYFDALTRRRGRWSSETEELSLLVEKAGVDMKAIWKQSAKSRALLKPEATGELAKLLADAKIKPLWERLYAEQEEYALAYSGDGSDHSWTKEIKERAVRANRLYDIWFDGAWDGFCPSWPTPCSDGTLVYVATHNNAVAAVRIADGSIAWLVWDHLGNENGERPSQYGAGYGTRFANSPVLYGNYFVVNNDSHVRAYDKRTGAKVWEHINPYAARKAELWARGSKGDAWSPDVGDMAQLDWNAVFKKWAADKKYQMASRATPEANSPCVVEVPLPDGSVLPVLWDGGMLVYRLEDGRVLRHDLPCTAQSSAVVAGNALMKNSENTFILHLSARNRDTLDTHYVHFVSGNDKLYPGSRNRIVSSTSDTMVYHDGHMYSTSIGGDGQSNATLCMSVTDGSYRTYAMVRAGGNPSAILVGSRLYDFSSVTLYKGPNHRHSVDGVGTAAYVDLENNQAFGIAKAVVDQRIRDDDEYAFRNAYMKAGVQGANASPSAQANRILMRTKGVLHCIGDPGEAFPRPKECPEGATAPIPAFETAALALTTEKDPAKLTAALSHAHPRVRREAARRLAALATTDHRPPTTEEQLQHLARKDLSVAVRAESFRALGLQPDQPGGVLLTELIGTAAGIWQRPDPTFGSLLKQLGGAVEPVALAILGSGTARQKENVAAMTMYRFIPPSGALRDALIPVLTQRSFDGLMSSCLSVWPDDPAVKAAFTAALTNDRAGPDHAAMFAYMLPLQKSGERLAFLKSVVGHNGVQNARSAAIAALIADGAVAEIRPLMAAAKARVPAEIAQGLAQACVEHQDPAVRAAAVDIIAKHLNQEDKHCQMGMVSVLGRFGAAATPALPAIKAIVPGEDKKLKDACDQAIAAIEKAAGEKK